MNNYKKYLKQTLALTSLSLTLAMPIQNAHAIVTTTSTTYQVSANVTTACTIGATNLAFGNYTGAQIDAQSSVVVNCTNNQVYDIGMNAGIGSGATIALRKMSLGANTLQYSLFSDSGRTTNWGNTVGIDTVSGTGTGAQQTYPVFGRLLPNQNAATGVYTDTITVTLTMQ